MRDQPELGWGSCLGRDGHPFPASPCLRGSESQTAAAHLAFKEKRLFLEKGGFVCPAGVGKSKKQGDPRSVFQGWGRCDMWKGIPSRRKGVAGVGRDPRMLSSKLL